MRRCLDEPLLGTVTMIQIPFVAHLLAGSTEASGVLAVVVAGLTISQAGLRLMGADTRLQMGACWSLATSAQQ